MNIQAFGKRDVANDHTETDRYEQQRFPILDYRHRDECNSYAYHYDVLEGHVGKACILKELLQAFNDCIHGMEIIRLLRFELLQEQNLPCLHGLL